MYEFWHNYVKSKYGEMQNFVIWIRQLHCPCKNMIFTKIRKQDLAIQILK